MTVMVLKRTELFEQLVFGLDNRRRVPWRGKQCVTMENPACCHDSLSSAQHTTRGLMLIFQRVSLFTFTEMLTSPCVRARLQPGLKCLHGCCHGWSARAACVCVFTCGRVFARAWPLAAPMIGSRWGLSPSACVCYRRLEKRREVVGALVWVMYGLSHH